MTWLTRLARGAALAAALLLLWPAAPATATRAVGVHRSYAALDLFTGTFSAATTTGAQAVTGIGFQPKAFILSYGASTSTLPVVTDFYLATIGWTDCTNQGVRAGRVEDAQFGHSSGHDQSNADIWLAPAANGAASTWEASFTSCDADGFTINWDLVASAITFQIHVIAIGGSGVTAKAGTFTQPGSTGNQATTGVGFAPDLVFFMPGIEGVTSTNTSGGNGMNDALGVMNAAGEQWSFSTMVRDNASGTGTLSSQRTDLVIRGLDHDNDSTTDVASWVSLDADGWTINWTSLDTGSNDPVWYLALDGVASKIGSANQPTSNGTQALSGFGFTPLGLLAASWTLVASTSVQSGTGTDTAAFAIGFAEGTEQTGMWQSGRHAVPTTPARAQWNDDLIRMYSAAATGSSSTLRSAADLQSFDADGATLNWTTTDATARQYLYVGLAAAGGGGGGATAPKLPAPLIFCCEHFWPRPAARR